MSKTKTPDQTAHLEKINNGIDACRAALGKLQETCCVAKRSERMIKLDLEIARLAEINQATDPVNVDEIDSGIGRVDNVGAALGSLYATCCTPTRERLYVAMFKSLGEVYIGLRRLKGSGH